MNQYYFKNRRQEPTETAGASRRSLRPVIQAIFTGLGIGLLAGLLITIWSPTISDWGYALYPVPKVNADTSAINSRALQKDLQRLEKRLAMLRQLKRQLTPREPYLIINTSENLITLKAGDKILHQGICSTGSYTLLKTADESEQWIFRTPRGRFRIQSKIQNPVWRMPDWAFIEEGRPVPPPYANERYEPGVLGDYALALGDGYLIHGTLYQRYLGLPVTHGCIRLADRELEIVYKNMQVGSKVFIY
ncbi:MAG: L,D-transpeptidase [candidate division KSB1 bacterium]|nr:L,D-transpeptidase [candidate division KSB1 bacterium]MDZ7317844.1 L,D-transpeptidase [candidate division KSB1 bacterium]MDZ7340338.1 L,D-transpeptidase [candidate division KSB1 bacterium]